MAYKGLGSYVKSLVEFIPWGAGPQGRLSRGQALSPAAVIGPMPVSGMERGVFSSENQDTGLLLWSND